MKRDTLLVASEQNPEDTKQFLLSREKASLSREEHTTAQGLWTLIPASCPDTQQCPGLPCSLTTD